MPQRHLDRLSAVDASFLHQERPAAQMHIGGIARFAGEPPEYSELLEHVRSRLHLVPRYRQRIATAPFGLGRQRWIDDPRFNLSYHVRHTALPAPGDDARLHSLAARIFSQRLDRAKPLWEMWMVEGLRGGGFALISKTHHALVDGVSGVDLMTMLFDLDPVPREVEPEVWAPNPEPSAAQLAAIALDDTTRRFATVPLRALTQPSRTLRDARQSVTAIGDALWQTMSPAPETPLNVAISPHRRIAVLEAPLADLKTVKNALGGTVNDVLLAIVAGGVRGWLHGRGIRTEGMDMRACVPISTRGEDGDGALGNRLTQVFPPLPVYLADPVERLRVVRTAMEGLKESRLAQGAETIAAMQDFAPPTILAQASRLNFSSRLFNLLVTNIPGPQLPLYVLGRKLEAVFPLAFLAGDRALAVAAMSYDGTVDIGLIADHDAMPDLDALVGGIRDSLAEYLTLAEGSAASARPA